jgi:hypothetical protein
MGVDVGALRDDILRVLAHLDTIPEGEAVTLPPELAPLIRLESDDSAAG